MGKILTLVTTGKFCGIKSCHIHLVVKFRVFLFFSLTCFERENPDLITNSQKTDFHIISRFKHNF